MTDRELIEKFLENRDQAAFGELVRRHLDLVYGVARRQVPGEAEDVAQAVFLLLSQRAREAGRHGNVAGWLFRVTQYCCLNLKRTEGRRVRHEHEAGLAMQMEQDKGPEDLAGVLDDALAELPRAYREAVLVRYLEGRSIAEAAATLGISEAAAAKRAARGLERLRSLFGRAGFSVGVAGVTALLASESAKATPLHVAGSVAAVSAQGTAATGKAAMLAHATGKGLAAAHLKVASAVLAGLLVTGAAVTGGKIFFAEPKAAPARMMLTSAPAVADSQAAPIAAVDEKQVPGNLYMARYDVLLNAAQADELRKISRAVPARGTFFDLRQGNAMEIREAIKAMERQGKLIETSLIRQTALPPLVKGYPWQGSLILPGLGSGTFFVDATTAAGAKYRESFGETLGYAEEREGKVNFRLDFDGCRLSLQALDLGPGEFLNRTGAMHWSGKVAAGEMILLMGDWIEWHGDHLATMRIFEIYKATPAEEPHVTRVAFETKRWLELGPAEALGIVDRALVWGANGEKNWLDGKEKWTKQLSDGTIVRLSGVGRPAEWPFCWWNPDGVPTAEPYPADYEGTGIPFAAVVKVLQPALSLKADPRGWRTGVIAAVPEGEKHLEVYVGTGPWTEQEIKPNKQVLVGDDGYVRMRRPNGAKEQTYVSLQGHLGPDVEVRLGAVAKDGMWLSGHIDDDAGKIMTEETPAWKADNYLFSIDGAKIDHYVLLSRKREKVEFDDFADAPVVQPPASVSADEMRNAEQAVGRMRTRGDSWAELWKVEEGELARLDALPRDEKTAIGSMRVMVDKARAGDAAGVKAFLRGTDGELVDKYAATMAAFGKVFDEVEKKFGREALMREFSKQRVMVSLEASYLEPDCEFSGGLAYGYRTCAPLVRSGDRWVIDLDRVTEMFPKENVMPECEKLIKATAALEKDLEAGKVKDAATGMDRLWDMEMQVPPVMRD